MHRIISKRALAGVVASLAVMTGSMSFVPAGADIIGTPTRQLTSLWTEWQDTACVAISVETLVTNYPTQTWNTKVSSAKNGGEVSFEASLKGFLSLSYTPTNYCTDAYVLNSHTLITNGALFFWNGSEWTVCNQQVGDVYGPDWASNPNPAWGFGFYGNGGSMASGCSAGWYYSDGMSAAWQNGAWRGVQPFWTNAGDSGPIWMN